MLHCSDLVLTDTSQNRDYYCKIFNLSDSYVKVIPVGADESLFHPKKIPEISDNNVFCVLFYGSFLPLQGIDTIVNAAAMLREEAIRIEIIGGKREKHLNVTRTFWLKGG